jgi:hypothetical protein
LKLRINFVPNAIMTGKFTLKQHNPDLTISLNGEALQVMWQAKGKVRIILKRGAVPWCDGLLICLTLAWSTVKILKGFEFSHFSILLFSSL